MEVPLEVQKGSYDWDQGAWTAYANRRLVTARSLKPADELAIEIELAKHTGASGACIQDADLALNALKLGDTLAVNDRAGIKKAVSDAKFLGLSANRVVKIAMDGMPEVETGVVEDCLSTLTEVVASTFKAEAAAAAIEEVEKVAGVIKELQGISASGDMMRMNEEISDRSSKSAILGRKYRVIRNVRNSEGHMKIKSFLKDHLMQIEGGLLNGCQEKILMWRGWNLVFPNGKAKDGKANPFVSSSCLEKLDALDAACTVEDFQAILMDFPMPTQLPPSKDARMDPHKLLAELSSNLQNLEAALKLLVDAKQAGDLHALSLLIDTAIQVDCMPADLLDKWNTMKDKEATSHRDDMNDEMRAQAEAERAEKARALGGACMEMREGKLVASIGVNEGGVFKPIIERDTDLPLQGVVKNLTNPAAQQKAITLQVRLSEEDGHNEKFADIEVEIRPEKKQTASINVIFDVCTLGILTISALNNKNKKPAKWKMHVT